MLLLKGSYHDKKHVFLRHLFCLLALLFVAHVALPEWSANMNTDISLVQETGETESEEESSEEETRRLRDPTQEGAGGCSCSLIDPKDRRGARP